MVNPDDVPRNPGRYVVMDRRVRSLKERTHRFTEYSAKYDAHEQVQLQAIKEVLDDLNVIIKEAKARPLKPAGRMNPELG